MPLIISAPASGLGPLQILVKSSEMLGHSVLSRRLTVPVLMFHGLCERVPEYALYKGGRSCLLPVEDFSALIQWAHQNFDVLRVSELDDLPVGRLHNYRPMVLTFDDGLASVIDYALPVLKEHGLSAVMFVTTDITDAARTPAIFHLERIASACIPASVKVEIDGDRIDLAIPSKGDAERSFQSLWAWLVEKHFPPLKLSLEHVMVNGRSVQREAVPEDRDFWFPASWEELKAAARAGILEIGSHMVSHTPLTWLASGKIREEMAGSRARLEREFGCRVTACAYPHGLANGEVCELAGAHYVWAFSDSGGLLRIISRRLCAPRIHVPSENWTAVKRVISWRGRASTVLRRRAGRLLKTLRKIMVRVQT